MSPPAQHGPRQGAAEAFVPGLAWNAQHAKWIDGETLVVASHQRPSVGFVHFGIATLDIRAFLRRAD